MPPAKPQLLCDRLCHRPLHAFNSVATALCSDCMRAYVCVYECPITTLLSDTCTHLSQAYRRSMLWTSHVLLCCGIIFCVAMAKSKEVHDTYNISSGGRDVVSRDAVSSSSSRGMLEEEVRTHDSDPRRSAVNFLFNLYRKLELKAEGADHRFLATPGQVIRALTPRDSRSFSCHPGLALSFNQSDVGVRPEYVELRLQHHTTRGSIFEAVGSGTLLLRMVDSAGHQIQQIHHTKWLRDEDGSIFTTITHFVQDLLTAVQSQANSSVDLHTASLQICPQGRMVRQQRSVENGALALRTEDFLLVVLSREESVTWENKLSQISQRRRRHRHQHGHYNAHLNKTSLRARRRAKKGRCTKTDMYVDFQTLGWSDDIVYPVTYNAGTCLGRCPSPVDHSLHPTNHAILQSMMRMHDRKLKRPCCVPVTLKPLMMIHNSTSTGGGSRVEIRTHPDMVVHECGCR